MCTIGRTKQWSYKVLTSCSNGNSHSFLIDKRYSEKKVHSLPIKRTVVYVIICLLHFSYIQLTADKNLAVAVWSPKKYLLKKWVATNKKNTKNFALSRTVIIV